MIRCARQHFFRRRFGIDTHREIVLHGLYDPSRNFISPRWEIMINRNARRVHIVFFHSFAVLILIFTQPHKIEERDKPWDIIKTAENYYPV